MRNLFMTDLRSSTVPGAGRRGPARLASPGGVSAVPTSARAPSGILGAMNIGLRDRVLPENQRRTLEELSDDLDLRSGDARAKQSAFWTMLVLSGIIASAGILADSTATVIGAMIIAPLSTPIMGIALGVVKRERIRAGRFVVLGARPRRADRGHRGVRGPDVDVPRNSQITSRTSPTVVDLIAAIATGVAGRRRALRRDVAAVLPGSRSPSRWCHRSPWSGSAWVRERSTWPSGPCCSSSPTSSRW